MAWLLPLPARRRGPGVQRFAFHSAFMAWGFAGAFASSFAQGYDPALLFRSVADRAPERALRTWSDAGAGVVLSASPPSGGEAHALHSAAGRYVAVCSGQIDNRAELCRDLERSGGAASGGSDLTLALSAFEAWGVEGAARRIEGSFTAAVWDVPGRRLSLLRDRLGINPLFFWHRSGLLAFGSDLAALRRLPGFAADLEPGALADYLRYLYVPGEWTLFRGVFKVRPGHLLTVTDPRDPPPPACAYWSLPRVARDGGERPFRGTEEEAVSGLDRLLKASVAAQMAGKGRVGALLSGGIDSTAVAAVAQEVSGGELASFAIGFEEADFDESAHAAAVAAHLRTAHTAIPVAERDVLPLLNRLAATFDTPIGNPSQIPMYLASVQASERVGVLLSGEGGDELFAGYNRYVLGERLIARALGVPRGARRALAGGIGVVGGGAWDRLLGALGPTSGRLSAQHGWGERLGKLAELLRHDSAAQMYHSLLSVWQDAGAFVISGGGARESEASDLLADDVRPLLDRMLLYDQMVCLPDGALAKSAGVSMAAGVGVGFPLLDQRIVEWSWRLPRAMKLRRDGTKWSLRQLLYRRVPKALVERPKMGFSVPVARWLRGGLRPIAEELLSKESLERSGVLRPALVRRAWQGFLSGERSEALGLWAIVMFQLWWEHWCAKPAAAEVAG